MAEMCGDPFGVVVVGRDDVATSIVKLVHASGHRATLLDQAGAAIAAADLVIQCGPESLQDRRSQLRAIAAYATDSVVIGCCTLVLPLSELRADLPRADQIVGTHFMHPADRLRLCEVILPPETKPATERRLAELLDALGVDAVVARDAAGFVLNRLLLPVLFDAVRLVEAGCASMDDIDLAMRRGCGWPAGPFEILDLVGLDVAASCGSIVAERLDDERFEPPSSLQELVAQGRVGRSCGAGFRAH